ncbi:MAG: type II secretion system protein [Candidatus Gastranaerophilaceae bacterium]
MGFTVAEMLVVMLILSIVLAAISTCNDNKKQDRTVITLEVFRG